MKTIGTSSTREELQRALREHLSETSWGFEVARMKGVQFGIVDPDRARFLGLHFEVRMITGGCAALHLPTDESLRMLEHHGSARNLEGRLCWVYTSGPGSGPVLFVQLIEES